MGLKKSNYKVLNMGIELPEAYAQVTAIRLRGDDCEAEIAIQKNRESIFKFRPIDRRNLHFKIDRSQNLLEQIYAKAKETYFGDWEDDIVTEENEETTPEGSTGEATA